MIADKFIWAYAQATRDEPPGGSVTRRIDRLFLWPNYILS